VIGISPMVGFVIVCRGVSWFLIVYFIGGLWGRKTNDFFTTGAIQCDELHGLITVVVDVQRESFGRATHFQTVRGVGLDH